MLGIYPLVVGKNMRTTNGHQWTLMLWDAPKNDHILWTIDRRDDYEEDKRSIKVKFIRNIIYYSLIMKQFV